MIIGMISSIAVILIRIIVAGILRIVKCLEHFFFIYVLASAPCETICNTVRGQRDNLHKNVVYNQQVKASHCRTRACHYWRRQRLMSEISRHTSGAFSKTSKWELLPLTHQNGYWSIHAFSPAVDNSINNWINSHVEETLPAGIARVSSNKSEQWFL